MIQNEKTALKRGTFCEERAVDFFQKKGWKLVAKNQRVGGVEIDLILENLTAYLLVEVKSDNSWRREYPISKNQKERLSLAFSVFCEQHKKPVQVQLAMVDQKSNVHTFDLEF